MNDRIGIIVPVEAKPHLFEAAVDFGVRRVELNGWNADLYTPALAESIRNEAGRLGIKITAFWAGWPGPKAWDFISGPETLGIVPPKFRPGRIAALKGALILRICSACRRSLPTWGLFPKMHLIRLLKMWLAQ